MFDFFVYICNYLFYLWGQSNFQLRLVNFSNNNLEYVKSDKKGSLISNLRSTFKTSRIIYIYKASPQMFTVTYLAYLTSSIDKYRLSHGWFEMWFLSMSA